LAGIKKAKKTVLLPSAIGDWTKYKPRIEDAVRNRNASKSASRFSEKEAIGLNLAFLGIFEEYSKALQKSSGLSLTNLSCSVEVDNYVDILKLMNMPVVQFKITAIDVEPIFLCFDMKLANALINSSVGGQADGDIAKSLTEIEESILETCAASGADRIIAGISPSQELKYLNSPNIYFDQSVDEASTLVLAQSEVSFGKQTGTIFIICHFATAQAIIAKIKGSKNIPNPEKLPPSITNKITMPVTSVLGTTLISAKELYELESGDVLVLDSSINNLLQVLVGKDLNILGQPGIKNDRLCVQILKNGAGKVERIKLSDPQLPDASAEDPQQAQTQENESNDPEEPAFPKEEV